MQAFSRRSFVALVGAACAASLVGCSDARSGTAGGNQPAANANAAAPENATNAAVPSQPKSKTLLAWFSRAGENYNPAGNEYLAVGHTTEVAGFIGVALGCDQYEIVPQVPYPEEYTPTCDIAAEELAQNARPAIANPLPDTSGYENIIVGCPIWWGDEPMIVRTFLEGITTAGKNIYVFTTHGGSGLGSTVGNFTSLCPAAHVNSNGFTVAGTQAHDAGEDVTAWLKSLNLTN
ncbi:MAG: flavodoxin [Coriobacteriia bacterium]|nr:flavodoxin [Coriobacteriia bacterium]